MGNLPGKRAPTKYDIVEGKVLSKEKKKKLAVQDIIVQHEMNGWYEHHVVGLTDDSEEKRLKHPKKTHLILCIL